MRILIVDDHPIIRLGIRQILSESHCLAVFDEAINGQEALEKIRKDDFDVVILDLSLPGTSGMEVLKKINQEKPGIRVLILSRYPEDQFAIPSLKAGALGFLPKSSLTQELVFAVRQVASGRQYITQSLSEILVSRLTAKNGNTLHSKLSTREIEIISKIASGKNNSEIAQELCLSPSTVSTYRARVMEKMGLYNSMDLLRYALENDLIE